MEKKSKKRYYLNEWWKYAKLTGIYNIFLNNYKKKIFFGIIKYNNKFNINLEKYLLYFGQKKLLSIFKYIKYIDSEKIDKYKGKKIKVIINNINNKIPSKKIIPIFISFEINKNENNKNIIKYLKKNEPIGCSNYFTLNYLVEKKIKSYYSGNYLILLGYKFINNNKKNKIFLDLNIIKILSIYKDLIEIFEKYKNEEYIFIKNDFSVNLNEKEKYKLTEDLFYNISSAKLVVTSNINIAFSCLGLETPIILIFNNNENYNFSIINEMFNIYGFYKNNLIRNLKFDKNQFIINKYFDIDFLNKIKRKFMEIINEY